MPLYLASASPPFWVIVQKHHNSHWLLEVASIKTQTKSCERETGPLGLRLSFKLSFPHILSRFDVWTLAHHILVSALFYSMGTIALCQGEWVTSRLCFWEASWV